MGAPQLVPHLHPLRILPDPAAPPEAKNPGALTRLERIVLAIERTAEMEAQQAAALVRLADRFDRIGDRMDKEAACMEELIAHGGTLAVESAARAVLNDHQRLAQALKHAGNRKYWED